MWAGCSNSLSYLEVEFGVNEDLKSSSVVNLQVGDNSVNSVPKPNSISRKLYSQVDDVADDSELKRELTLFT